MPLTSNDSFVRGGVRQVSLNSKFRYQGVGYILMIEVSQVPAKPLCL
jgi:hypothetical protein